MAERRRALVLSLDGDAGPAAVPPETPPAIGQGDPPSAEEHGSAETLRKRQRRWLEELARHESRRPRGGGEPPRQP